MGLSHREAFEAVENLVKTWKVGNYMHYTQLLSDNGDAGLEFNVIFSKPTSEKPIPSEIANVSVNAMPAGDDAELSYAIECEMSRHPADEQLVAAQLDAIIMRKLVFRKATAQFEQTGELPRPKAFVPGQYHAAEALKVIHSMEGEDAQDQLEDTIANLEEARAMQEEFEIEATEELEQQIVNIFHEADTSGDGLLSIDEFQAVMTTGGLMLSKGDVHSLMMQADRNNDGFINYAEFVPVAVEVIHALRQRRVSQASRHLDASIAEMRAFETIHNLGPEELNEALREAFRTADKDDSGTLSRSEFFDCISQITLGRTSLTRREINALMLEADTDRSGDIDFEEFAPLVYNCLVRALQEDFLSHEDTDLEAYLREIFVAQDAAGTGTLTAMELKLALSSADLLQLTSVQIFAVLSEVMGSVSDLQGCTEEFNYHPLVQRIGPLLRRFKDNRCVSAFLPLSASSSRSRLGQPSLLCLHRRTPSFASSSLGSQHSVATPSLS